MSMKNSSDAIRDRTVYLPACSAMLQQTAPLWVVANIVGFINVGLFSGQNIVIYLMDNLVYSSVVFLFLLQDVLLVN
jgi:uncharacterized membrane protein YGL010W